MSSAPSCLLSSRGRLGAAAARSALAVVLLIPAFVVGLAADPAAGEARRTPTSATAALAAARTSAAKVLVLGVDGLRLDRAVRLHTPALHGLMARGQTWRTQLYAPPFAATVSGPGWATDATGTWPDKHEVRENDWGQGGTGLSAYPDFLTRLERARPALRTYAASGWPALTGGGPDRPVFSSAVDERVSLDGDADGWPGVDAEVTERAARRLATDAPDASFVYFGDVDEAGHECGAAGGCYAASVERTDAHLARLLRVVAARERAGEDWTVLLTTDHGHTDAGGHGGATPHERASFIVLDGPGAVPGASTGAAGPVRNVDLAATVLSRLDVPVPATMDGRPLGSADPDPFDRLSRVVGGGATHLAPPGWRVDDTAMGSGGDPQWRGWAFTDDPHWSAADRYQGREGNVRERGTFAVADSDEWADRAHGGRFDSTLRSPSYDVGGARRAVVRFASHYKAHAGQAATVAVSFDDGPARVVRTWTADRPHAVEQVPVTVPAGARSLRVQWRLSGVANGWYWAVDEPQVLSGAAGADRPR